jgi:microcin C transport system substrate-binding protein
LTRKRAREALGLLAEAGWKLDNGRLLNIATGEPFTFTVLAQTASQEKVLGQYFESLRRFGILGQLQIVDGATYEHRLRTGKYDLAYRFIIQPQWPGREQRRFWGSKDASRAGDNASGLHDPDIDTLVEAVIAARNLDDLTLRARVLDRALQWAVYVIPGFHESHRHVAYWKRIQRPAVPTKYGYGLEYWWCSATDADGR